MALEAKDMGYAALAIIDTNSGVNMLKKIPDSSEYEVVWKMNFKRLLHLHMKITKY